LGTGFTMDARTTGASCSAGWGCVMKNCANCLCSVGVNVSLRAAGATFTTTAPVDWNGSLSFNMACGTCAVDTSGTGGSGVTGTPQPLNNDPPPPAGDYGSGGSGSTIPGGSSSITRSYCCGTVDKDGHCTRYCPTPC